MKAKLRRGQKVRLPDGRIGTIVKSKPIDISHDPITGKPMEPFVYYVTSDDQWGRMLANVGVGALQYYPTEIMPIREEK